MAECEAMLYYYFLYRTNMSKFRHCEGAYFDRLSTTLGFCPKQSQTVGRLLTALPKVRRDDVAYGASVAAEEQERRLATTSHDMMYGREITDKVYYALSPRKPG